MTEGAWPAGLRFETLSFDNNATTRPDPSVVDAVAEAMRHRWANPSSVHRAGQEARHALELARGSVASLLGAAPGQVTFTSGATESLALALASGLRKARVEGRVPVVATTPIEHAALRLPLEAMARAGTVRLWMLPIDRDGVVDLEGVTRACEVRVSDRPDVCAVGWANNETGVVQPVHSLGSLMRQRFGEGSVRVIVDATQWVGKMPVAAGELAKICDYAACSSHKWHGPKGVGMLWTRPGAAVLPLFEGTQEQGRRGGTENVEGIVGAGVAAALATSWVADAANIARQRGLRDGFESAVLAAVPGAVSNGPRDPLKRLWNTSNIGFPRLEAEALLMAFSERGLAASAGAACSSGSLDPSPVLLAMGVVPEVAHGSVRFSMSRHTTAEEVERAVKIVVEGYRRVLASGGG